MYKEFTGIDPEQPVVLVIDALFDGVKSAIKASGRQYITKLLKSSPENWQSICDLFLQYKIAAVVCLLDYRALERITDPEYGHARERLADLIRTVPHRIFAHISLCATGGEESFDSDTWETSLIKLSMKFLAKSGLEVVPYETNAELTVAATSFLSETAEGTFLRIYISDNRIWAKETSALIDILYDYLHKIGRSEFTINRVRTGLGTIVEFRNRNAEDRSAFAQDLNDFKEFVGLCAEDPDAAAQFLTVRDVKQSEIFDLIAKSKKDIRRLRMDIRQEYDRKLLSVVQQLESDQAEVWEGEIHNSELRALAHSVLPESSDILGQSRLLSVVCGPSDNEASSLMLMDLKKIRPTLERLRSGVMGEDHLSPGQREAVAFVRDHGGPRTQELETAVLESADPGLNHVRKEGAKRKLWAFFRSLPGAAGKVFTGVLQTYIENELGLN
jgi:hypothetical protein